MAAPAPPTAPAKEGEVYKTEWNEKRSKKLHKAFDKYLKDGKLEPSELHKTMKEFKYHLTEEQNKQLLDSLDKNKDGKITWEEFEAGIKAFVAGFPRKSKKPEKHSKEPKKSEK